MFGRGQARDVQAVVVDESWACSWFREMDVRVGASTVSSSNRAMRASERTSKVTPHSRLVWTNEEGGRVGVPGDFEEKDGKTLMVMQSSILEGSSRRMPAPGRRRMGETFEQGRDSRTGRESGGHEVIDSRRPNRSS